MARSDESAQRDLQTLVEELEQRAARWERYATNDHHQQTEWDEGYDAALEMVSKELRKVSEVFADG